MAYYAMFSLFPLLLALVIAGSYFLERGVAYQEVVRLVSSAIPISRSLIEQNVRQVLELRGTVGLIGLVTLVWAATGVFTSFARNINRAWPEAEGRNFFEGRLVALAMIAVLGLLLVLSLVSTAALEVLPSLGIPWVSRNLIGHERLWRAIGILVPALFSLLLFLAMYRWVPSAEVAWSDALWGALVATLGWEIAKRAFAWYLDAGLASYRLVYGSLGTVIALMFWLYLSAWIALLGAHITAAAGQRD